MLLPLYLHVFTRQYAELSPDQSASNGGGVGGGNSSLAEHQILGAMALVTLFAGLTRFFGVAKVGLWTAMFVGGKLILLKDIYCSCT